MLTHAVWVLTVMDLLLANDVEGVAIECYLHTRRQARLAWAGKADRHTAVGLMWCCLLT